MNRQELERAIQILTQASEVITNLDRDFKTARGIYNLDHTLDDIANELTAALEVQNIQEETSPKKIWMEKLVIVWSEGLRDENIQYTSWDDFNLALDGIAREHDKDGYTGAYAKTTFEIHWADGEIHKGRLDVNTKSDTNVGQHALEWLQFHTGEHKPNHMTEEEYRNYMGWYSNEQQQQQAKNYLERYEIVI